MASEQIIGPITRTRLRRFVFVWGWGVFLLFVGFALRIGPPVSPEGPGNEQIVQQIMLAGGGLAMLLAWRWEGLGGFVLTFAAIVLGVLAAIGFPPLQALGVTVLFLVPGIALLVLWSSQHQWFVMAASGAVVAIGMAAGGYAATSLHAYYFGPAHPESTLAALPASAIEWVWSGALAPTSIRVNAKVSEGGTSARLAIAEDAAFAAPIWSEPRAVADGADRVVSFGVGGLSPGTAYHYAVEVDDELDLTRQGTFTTPGEGPYSFTIALGSCARVGSNGAVFDAIRERDPLLFLALGDFHYGNIETNNLGKFRSTFDETLSTAAQSALYRVTPIAYTWDDHDFGGNNSNGDSDSAPAAQAAYREIVPHYPFAASGDDAGAIYQTFTIGRLRFLLTDSRSDRRGDTMLGANQLAWLETEMLAARDAGELIVFINSVPWIAEGGTGDEWSGFPDERTRIANFIAEQELTKRIVMLSGDAHMLAMDDGSNSNYSDAPGAGFPVIHAAALDRPGSKKGGPYSEGAYPGAGQFATMTVTDDGGETIQIAWHGYDWEQTEIVSLQMEFAVPAVAAASS